MIKRKDLVRALGKQVADWVIVERTQEIATADALHFDKLMRRREQRTRTTLLVHVDDPRGRGSARVHAGGSEAPGELVSRAIALAQSAIGPAWKSVPAAAPAKVTLLDPSIAKRDVQFVAIAIAGAQRTAATCARVTREQVTIETRAGLTATWDASLFEVDALVSDDKHSLAIHRAARRESDLALDAAIAGARAHLELLARAQPVQPGPCTLVLDIDALLHDDVTGLWSVFATQADAVRERQGLARYRVGVAVAPGSDTVTEPLTITSNGALDFATRSAPLGDDGDAVRRFPLVERGIAKGFGLTPREAALRGVEPNGGVRNLVVLPGTWDGKPGGDMRTIWVHRLRGVALDPYTGEASLELAIAVEHPDRVFTGGTVRLDLVAALSHARRMQTTVRRGAYDGPVAVRIDGAMLVG